MKKVVILGAGISGLSAGWFLKQKFGNRISLEIWEKSGRVGGWIKTLREGRYLLEAGPRGFRSAGRGEATLELVRGLGLEGALMAASPEAKKRYIALNGKLHPFGLPFLLKQGALGALWHDLFIPKREGEDESVASFITRRFNRRLAETVMDPLTKGIYGGDMHQLSMRSCFPKVWQLEREHGSVIRGLWATRKKKEKGPASLYTFRDGMETLTTALAKELKNEIHLEKPAPALQEIEADLVISTVPMYELCPYATLSSVHLGWEKRVLPKRGYGFLVPSLEKEPILGMTWDSEIFPRGEQTQICVMIAGKEKEEVLVQQALKSLKKYTGIKEEPQMVKITVAEEAIPQYTLHHEERKEALRRQLPAHVKLLGTSVGGPGVNDCLFTARAFVHGLSF